MKVLIVFTFVCTAIIQSAFSQVSRPLDIDVVLDLERELISNEQKIIDISSPVALAKSQIKGIYLDPIWRSGVIFTVNGEKLTCPTRYNIHRRRIEVVLGEDTRVLHPVAINAVQIDDKVFIPLTSDEEDDGTNIIYFEVLSFGEYALLKKYRLTLHTTGGTALHTNLGSGKEYRSHTDFYYAKSGENAQRLKTGKKHIKHLVEGVVDDIESYVDENGLGYKKEKDLKLVFDWINEQG